MDLENGGRSSSAQQSSEQQRQTAAAIARKKVLAAYNNKAMADAVRDEAQAGATGGAASGVSATGALGGMAEGARGAGAGAASGAGAAGMTSGAGAAGAGANATSGAGTETHLKSQPMARKANPEDWRKYHSAWQDYYQKYYSEYYANAARNYVEKERLRDARRRAEEEDTLSAIGKFGGFGAKKARQAAGGVGVAGAANGATAAGTMNGAAAGGAEATGAGMANGMAANGALAANAGAQQTPEQEIDSIGAKLKDTIRKKAVKDVKKSRRRRRWIPVVAGVFVVLFILFMQYNRLIFAPIFAYMSPGNAPASSIEAIDPTITQTVSADPRLIIPKLNVDVPIHFGLSLSEVMGAMNNGVAHYRIAGASAYPGELGNTVITGHSAGDVYSPNPYKYIFSGLERLEEGDLIYVNYQSVRYTYQVSGKKVVEPTDVKALVVESDVPMLTLVTCTPLGTSRYRLLVFAEQIAPSPTEAEAGDEGDTTINIESDDDEGLPSNEPSFFEGIWSFLTGGNG